MKKNNFLHVISQIICFCFVFKEPIKNKPLDILQSTKPHIVYVIKQCMLLIILGLMMKCENAVVSEITFVCKIPGSGGTAGK